MTNFAKNITNKNPHTTFYLVFNKTCAIVTTLTFITQSNVLLACIPTSKSFLNDTGISIELPFSHFLQ